MKQLLSEVDRQMLVAHLVDIGWQPDSHGDLDCVDQGAAMAAQEIEALVERVEYYEAYFKNHVTWPPTSVIRELVRAADHLLDVHGCDTDQHELFITARSEAKTWLSTQEQPQ